jgi:hypothetical protein
MRAPSTANRPTPILPFQFTCNHPPETGQIGSQCFPISAARSTRCCCAGGSGGGEARHSRPRRGGELEQDRRPTGRRHQRIAAATIREFLSSGPPPVGAEQGAEVDQGGRQRRRPFSRGYQRFESRSLQRRVRLSLLELLSRVENPGFPRGCAPLAWRPGRQRRAGCYKIAPTGGNISVAPYSSTAVPLMGSARMPRRSQ